MRLQVRREALGRARYVLLALLRRRRRWEGADRCRVGRAWPRSARGRCRAFLSPEALRRAAVGDLVTRSATDAFESRPGERAEAPRRTRRRVASVVRPPRHRVFRSFDATGAGGPCDASGRGGARDAIAWVVNGLGCWLPWSPLVVVGCAGRRQDGVRNGGTGRGRSAGAEKDNQERVRDRQRPHRAKSRRTAEPGCASFRQKKPGTPRAPASKWWKAARGNKTEADRKPPVSVTTGAASANRFECKAPRTGKALRASR
jgi:hypothetical protein